MTPEDANIASEELVSCFMLRHRRWLFISRHQCLVMHRRYHNACCCASPLKQSLSHGRTLSSEASRGVSSVILWVNYREKGEYTRCWHLSKSLSWDVWLVWPCLRQRCENQGAVMEAQEVLLPAATTTLLPQAMPGWCIQAGVISLCWRKKNLALKWLPQTIEAWTQTLHFMCFCLNNHWWW